MGLVGEAMIGVWVKQNKGEKKERHKKEDRTGQWSEKRVYNSQD